MVSAIGASAQRRPKMNRTTYAVLAVDGGGMDPRDRPGAGAGGVEVRMRRAVCELFDLVAGTSTGGVIALWAG
jgi:patatin-like phospholipase/acyl hydrolase